MDNANRSNEPDEDKNQTARESEETNDEARHSDLEENIQSQSTSTSRNENLPTDGKLQANKDSNELPWRKAPRLVTSKDPNAIAEGFGNISLDTGLGVPSLENVRMVLIYPKANSVKNLYEDSTKAGKWMLFGSGDYERMDFYWRQMKPLCDAGIIAALKTSTIRDPRGGVLRAYTTDSDNKQNVKDVAEKIFEATGYDADLYYKTNEASSQGMYRHEGMSNIALYKHDKNIFFIKEGNQWQPWPEKDATEM